MAAVRWGRIAVLLFTIASSQAAGQPRHCTPSSWPEVAVAVPGDVVVRLCGFASPRPKLAAVSKGHKPDLNNMLLVNFEYTDTTSNRGHFIFVIANATAADLGNYTLVAFANRTETTLNFRLVAFANPTETTLNFRLVSSETTQASRSEGEDNKTEDNKTIWIIVAVLPASLMLVVLLVVLVAVVCRRRSRKGAKISGAALLSNDVYALQQGHNEQGPSAGTSEREYGGEGVSPRSAGVHPQTQDPSQPDGVGNLQRTSDQTAVEADVIYEAVEQDRIYNNDIASTNNEGCQYSSLDQESADKEQNEYFKFNYSSDQQTYINIS